MYSTRCVFSIQCSTATIFGLEAQGTWNAEKEKDVIADISDRRESLRNFRFSRLQEIALRGEVAQ